MRTLNLEGENLWHLWNRGTRHRRPFSGEQKPMLAGAFVRRLAHGVFDSVTKILDSFLYMVDGKDVEQRDSMAAHEMR